VAAFKQLEAWDFDGVLRWPGRKGIEWHLVPTIGQHFNGQGERMIGILKKQMQRSFEGKWYSHKEVCILLQENAQIVNSRPLFSGQWTEAESLRPAGLLLGMATTQVPLVRFELAAVG
jgi:hypothetical protein